MPIDIGDEIELPDDNSQEGWCRVRLIRRGTDEKSIERPSRVPNQLPIRIPVWIVEVTAGPQTGETRAVPNGTVARVML